MKSDAEKAEEFFQSGMKYLESHQYKSVILDFKNAVQKNPNLAKAYFQMGLAYVDSGEVRLGFIEMRTAVRLAPENESFLNTYANLSFFPAEAISVKNTGTENTKANTKSAFTVLPITHIIPV